MRMREMRIKSSPKLMIIPMIDIIFFLLVFFMVSSLQMVYQSTLAVNLPQSVSARHDVTQPLAVTIQQDGRIALAEELVAENLLAAKVERALKENPELPVVIRADEKVEHGQLLKVMDQLKLAGVTRLAIAAEQKGL